METHDMDAGDPGTGATPFDTVVIGGGAAGLSAALVLGRARRAVAVVDGGAPRNAPAAHMQGYLSRDGMPPADLLHAGRAEVAGYGATLVEGQVAGIAWRGVEPGFLVTLADGRELCTRTVLVATGVTDVLPDVAGLRSRWGVDVLHCPYCHGYEVRDEPIAVLGGEVREMSLHQAFLLRQWSGDVVFFPNGIDLTADERERMRAHGVEVVDGEVSGVVVVDDRLDAVELADGRRVRRSAVFVGPRAVPHDELLTALGCQVGENGCVTADPAGRTSVPGIWAAGNVVDPRAQVITVAGAGSAAGIAINGYLVEDDVAVSVVSSRESLRFLW